MSGESLPLTWLPILGSLALKSLLVFLVAGAALLALRRASASARHLVCLLTLAGLLALPLLSLALPGWRLAVLAAPQSGEEPAPRQVAAPPETGGGGVLDAGKAGAASSAPTPLVLTSSSSRSGRTPASEANKEVGSAFPWPLFLLALWLAGALLAALRPLLGLWGIARLSQTSAAVLDAPALALTAECASALGLARMPALRQADAPVPMTWGWHRPVVLLPADARGWPEGRLRAVLLHELAHVRRRDWLSHRLADVVCALYWFHPLAWLTARRLKMEGEIACDDLVLNSGVAAPDYARHLLDVARALRPASAAVPQAAIAMARTARIEGRLTMILDTTRPRRALTRRALLLVLTPGVAALVTLAMLRLDAKAQASPAPAAIAAAPIKTRTALPLPASKTLIRYFLSPGPPYRLMKKQGRGNPVAWGKSQPASLPIPPPSQVTPKAVPSSSRSVSAVPRHPIVRVAQLPPATSIPVMAPEGPHPVRSAPAAPVSAPASPAGEVSVDLAGVTDGSGKWWSASGALLPVGLWDLAAYHRGDYWGKAAAANKPHLDFAFRVSPSDAKDVTLRYSLDDPHAAWSSTLGTWPEKMQGGDGQTEAQINAATNGLRVFSMTYTAAPVSRQLVLSVASGPWAVAATGNVSTYGPASAFGEHAYFFGPLFETDGKGRITISTNNTEDDVRVVALDAQGQATLPLEIGDNSAGNMSQIDVRFALPAAQIKRIRVEVRHFRQVVFKDVALQPTK